MPHFRCTRCDTQITVYASVVERHDNLYCCNNCAQFDNGQAQPAAGRASCAHCKLPIVNATNHLERGGVSYCCGNCANAMSLDLVHRATQPA